MDLPDAHRFEVRVGDAVAGYVEYRRDGGTTSFVHTLIEPGFEGRGLGSVLARGALDATRAAGRSVRPVCPFVRGWIERHPEYQDLVTSPSA